MKQKKVYYYNINYFCNNQCVFCFSYNVGNEKKEIEYERIVNEIETSNLCRDDIIVINGGEPTLSCYFEKLLIYLSKLKNRVVIYTNGRKLKEKNFCNSDNIQFVIPVHGNKVIHDNITRVEGAYMETVDSLKYLQKNHISYSIKFILNDEMIRENMDIYEFITRNKFTPKEIVLARLNTTKKSKANNYYPPEYINEKKYLLNCFEKLRLKYNITILDFPPCYFDGEDIFNIEIEEMDTITFLFSDWSHSLHERSYKKMRLEFGKCYQCRYEKICNLMSESYYTLKYNKNEDYIVLTLE